MKRWLLGIFVVLIAFLSVRADGVMRYKLLKVLTGEKVTQTGGNSTLYVTLSGNKCYDSDSQGYSNNTGVRSLRHENYGFHSFTGPTYWGNGEYLFSEDYSRLNVKVGNKVYVYTKTAFSPGKSSYIGTRSSSGTVSGGYTPKPSNNGGTRPSGGKQAPLSASQYQQYYNKYADQAKSIYETVTYKIRYADGTSDRRSNYEPYSDSYVAYNGMLRNLRECQSEMRKLREEAARYGISLVKSPYETITVKF